MRSRSHTGSFEMTIPERYDPEESVIGVKYTVEPGEKAVQSCDGVPPHVVVYIYKDGELINGKCGDDLIHEVEHWAEEHLQARLEAADFRNSA